MSSGELQKKSKLLSDFLKEFGNVSPAEAVLQLNGKNCDAETPPPSPVAPSENADEVNDAEAVTDGPADEKEIDERKESTADNSAHGQSDDETGSSPANSPAKSPVIPTNNTDDTKSVALCDSYQQFMDNDGASSTVVGLHHQKQNRSPGENRKIPKSKRPSDNSTPGCPAKKIRIAIIEEKTQKTDCVSQPTTNAAVSKPDQLPTRDLPRDDRYDPSIFVVQNADSSASSMPPSSQEAPIEKSSDSFHEPEPPAPFPKAASAVNQVVGNTQDGTKKEMKIQKGPKIVTSEKLANSGKAHKIPKNDDDGKVKCDKCGERMKNLNRHIDSKRCKENAKKWQKSTSPSHVISTDLPTNEPTNKVCSSEKDSICSDCGTKFGSDTELVSHIVNKFSGKRFSFYEWIKRNNENRLHDP